MYCNYVSLLLILDQNLWDALPERFRAPRFLEPIGIGSGRYLDEEGGGHRPREGDALWLEMSLLRAWVGSEFSWKGFPPRCGGGAYIRGCGLCFRHSSARYTRAGTKTL